jgi:hypothetical protein
MWLPFKVILLIRLILSRLKEDCKKLKCLIFYVNFRPNCFHFNIVIIAIIKEVN